MHFNRTEQRCSATYNIAVAPQQLGTLVIAIIVVLNLSACGATSPKEVKPVVTVVTPLDGARYQTNTPIPLTVAAVASRNVARVELSVNGGIVATQVNPEPSPTFSTRIEYTPQAQGRLQLAVAAIDSTGVSSDPFTLTLIVGEEATAMPQPAQLPEAATASETPGVVGPNGCILSATFLQDVNVPDGTTINAGATFTKTWRMKNTSSCDWGEGYTLAFVADTPMHPTGSEPIQPTPSNAMIDVSVSLVAPAQPGVYTSTWRLKDPSDHFFGNQVYVVIRVP